MRFLRRSLLAPTLAVGLIAGGLTATGTAAQQAMTVNISAQNDSGISGTATLTPMGNQTQVVVQLQNAPGPHPIHFHEGTCADLSPQVKIPLTTVQNGRSETTVSASIQDLTAVQHSINVHKSPQEASVYVACGSLTTGPGAQQAGGQAPGALPRSGDAENWGIGGLTVVGLMLLGAGLVARRRGVV
jgi:hypothetical protein